VGLWRVGLGAAVLSLCAACLTACGDGDRNRVIVRVDGAPIRAATLTAWARAIETGSAAEPSSAPAYASARQKALDYLISAHWLIGEAAARGLGVSVKALQRGLSERIEAAPKGRAEFEGPSAGKQTISGLKLEVQAELAAARLRSLVARDVAPVTHADVLDYYRRHRASYRIRQQRRVDLVENLPSRAAAIALGRRLGTGRRFAARAYHELVASTPPFQVREPKFNTGLLHAIFSARPGALAGPVAFNDAWTLLVVRRVMPGMFVSLAGVETLIARRLREQHRGAALARFAGPYRAKWRARTSCRPGFVVAKCRQYRGPAPAEGDPLADW
jgi:foldase protein PrsA